MKTFTFVLVCCVAVMFVGSALAVAPDKKIEYAGGTLGKVVFDGKTHSKTKCNECHVSPKIWPMKKGAKLTQADHVAGKSCGSCHDGKKAFDVAAKDGCGKCHKK
jgi:c(7)-type cytochrome triheme protein